MHWTRSAKILGASMHFSYSNETPRGSCISYHYDTWTGTPDGCIGRPFIPLRASSASCTASHPPQGRPQIINGAADIRGFLPLTRIEMRLERAVAVKTHWSICSVQYLNTSSWSASECRYGVIPVGKKGGWLREKEKRPMAKTLEGRCSATKFGSARWRFSIYLLLTYNVGVHLNRGGDRRPRHSTEYGSAQSPGAWR